MTDSYYVNDRYDFTYKVILNNFNEGQATKKRKDYF